MLGRSREMRESGFCLGCGQSSLWRPVGVITSDFCRGFDCSCEGS